ncbi:hypothetical protein FPZ54_02280 [Sphingomonas suaedae]|uniref:Uncharacterized protein n=1 Tax=Sphingomonas suaedae TaxID=2599297 RepID=A0A518RBY0_9SPHN|nr:hypothetical protein [Sphingomonas suaedae]QDX24972.1 hypothetical protein FPZ54_02280 [Sphingomonas suaedae]
MIEFEAPPEDLKLLRRVVKQARKNKDPFPSLTDLAPRRSVDELIELGKSWQRAGLGRVIEEMSADIRSVSFTVDEAAFEAIRKADQGTLWGRLAQVPRSDWIAIAAFVVSVFALFKGD